jgi:hypothetical protein
VGNRVVHSRRNRRFPEAISKSDFDCKIKIKIGESAFPTLISPKIRFPAAALFEFDHMQPAFSDISHITTQLSLIALQLQMPHMSYIRPS